MLQQVNQNLKQIVPYYQEASQFTCETYNNTIQSANEFATRLGTQVDHSKKNVIRIKNGL